MGFRATRHQQKKRKSRPSPLSFDGFESAFRGTSQDESGGSPLLFQPELHFFMLDFFDMSANHTFAMWKFADAADQLVADGVVRCAEDFVAPAEPIPDELFLLAHDRAYYDAFVHDTLEPALSRRIGFVRIIPVLIYLCTPAHS